MAILTLINLNFESKMIKTPEILQTTREFLAKPARMLIGGQWRDASTTKLLGDTIPLSLPCQFLNYTTREPLGVVVGITPPNYPLTMPLYKTAPALATGNTIIIKPSEDTSLVALRLGGNSPNIVFADADLEAALKGVFTGIFFCQGEICSAGSRLLIEQYRIQGKGPRSQRRQSGWGRENLSSSILLDLDLQT